MEIANKLGVADTYISEQEKAETKRARQEAFEQIAALLNKVPAQGLETAEEEKRESR